MADEDAGSGEKVAQTSSASADATPDGRSTPAVAEPSAADDPGSPTWALPRGTVVLLTIAGIVVAVLGIKSIGSIVGPVFLGLIMTVAVAPVPGWLRRKGWPKWTAFLATVLLVYGIILGLFGSVIYCIARLATILPQYSDKFNDLIDDVQQALSDHGIGQDKVNDMLSHVDAGKVFDVVGDVVSSTANAASALILVLTVLLFMAVDSINSDERFAVLKRVRPDVAHAFDTFASGTRNYLVVSTVFGLIVAVFDTGALWLMGIPLPLLWGLLSFITNYIPNIGFVLGVIPPAILALLDGGWMLALWVIVIYSVINFVIQSVIQPKFVGDSVGLTTTVTFLSLIFWAWVIGPLGALLAIPLTLLCKSLLLDIDPSTRWTDVLISSGRPTTDEVEEARRHNEQQARIREEAQQAHRAGDGGEDTVAS